MLPICQCALVPKSLCLMLLFQLVQMQVASFWHNSQRMHHLRAVGICICPVLIASIVVQPLYCRARCLRCHPDHGCNSDSRERETELDCMTLSQSGRHLWGPAPAHFQLSETGAPAPRKRKSRWASGGSPGNCPATGSVEGDKAIVLFPEKVVLSNGLQVVLPPAVTGRAPGGDPEVLELHKEVRGGVVVWLGSACGTFLTAYMLPSIQLNDINRKLLNGMVDIPPEGQRSPSPPPIYDVMGMR